MEEYWNLSQSPAPAAFIARLNRQFKTSVLCDNATWAQLHVASLFLQGSKGDVAALKEIADRIEGRPPKRLDLASMERQEITIRLQEDDPLPPQTRGDGSLIRDLDILVQNSNDEEIKQAASALALQLRQRVNRKIDSEST